MSWKTKRTRRTRKHRKTKMGGGIFDFLGTSTTSTNNNYGTSDLSNWFNMESFTKGASDFWNKTKKAASDSYTSMSGKSDIPGSHVQERKEMPTYVPPPTYTQQPPLPSQPQYMTPFGGRRMKKSRYGGFRGGYNPYSPTTGLAFNAAPFSGYTAQPQVWVGGKMKTKKRRTHKKNKSNKHH